MGFLFGPKLGIHQSRGGIKNRNTPMTVQQRNLFKMRLKAPMGKKILKTIGKGAKKYWKTQRKIVKKMSRLRK